MPPPSSPSSETSNSQQELSRPGSRLQTNGAEVEIY